MARLKKDGVTVNYYLTREAAEFVRTYADEHDMTLTAVIEKAIKLLKKEDQKKQ